MPQSLQRQGRRENAELCPVEKQLWLDIYPHALRRR